MSLEVMPKSRRPLSRASVRPDSTVSNEYPTIRVPLRVEENLHVRYILRRDLLQVGKREIEKILPGAQHGHSCVVQVEKILE